VDFVYLFKIWGGMKGTQGEKQGIALRQILASSGKKTIY
jgi:hypothetical protein